MLQEKHISLHRQEDGRATANACCPSKETVGASSPQPFLPRRTGRALALPIACLVGQVATVSGIAQARLSTRSGTPSWIDNRFRNTAKCQLATILGISCWNVNLLRTTGKSDNQSRIKSQLTTCIRNKENEV